MHLYALQVHDISISLEDIMQSRFQFQEQQPIKMLDSTPQVAMVAVKLCHPNCDFIVDGNKGWHVNINHATVARKLHRKTCKLRMCSQRRMCEKIR